MKRTLSILVAIIAGALIAMAGSNPFRLKSGSLRELKHSGGTIYVEMDFSKTRANRKPFEQYLTEDFGTTMKVFERYQPEMMRWFCERWDDDIDDGPKAVETDGAPYRLVLVIKTLNLGAKSGMGGGASASGYAEFYRQGESEPFATVEMLKFYGTILGGSVPGFPGLKQTFSDMAEYLCDTIYHNK
ncbi:MAG: hypothetical protein NC418_03585 [Muribaculaceae bacterium]|nr:hypothetical protein [Muribaculaceae bacterium]